MPQEFDDILNECIDDMRCGGTLDNCLKLYPQQAAELKPLLIAIRQIILQTDGLKARPESRAALKEKLIRSLEK